MFSFFLSFTFYVWDQLLMLRDHRLPKKKLLRRRSLIKGKSACLVVVLVVEGIVVIMLRPTPMAGLSLVADQAHHDLLPRLATFRTLERSTRTLKLLSVPAVSSLERRELKRNVNRYLAQAQIPICSQCSVLKALILGRRLLRVGSFFIC